MDTRIVSAVAVAARHVAQATFIVCTTGQDTGGVRLPATNAQLLRAAKTLDVPTQRVVAAPASHWPLYIVLFDAAPGTTDTNIRVASIPQSVWKNACRRGGSDGCIIDDIDAYMTVSTRALNCGSTGASSFSGMGVTSGAGTTSSWSAWRAPSDTVDQAHVTLGCALIRTIVDRWPASIDELRHALPAHAILYDMVDGVNTYAQLLAETTCIARITRRFVPIPELVDWLQSVQRRGLLEKRTTTLACTLLMALPAAQLPVHQRALATSTAADSVAHSTPGVLSHSHMCIDGTDPLPFGDVPHDLNAPITYWIAAETSLLMLAMRLLAAPLVAKDVTAQNAVLGVLHTLRQFVPAHADNDVSEAAVLTRSGTACWPPRATRQWAFLHSPIGTPELSDVSTIVEKVLPTLARQHLAALAWDAYRRAQTQRETTGPIATQREYLDLYLGGVRAKQWWFDIHAQPDHVLGRLSTPLADAWRATVARRQGWRNAVSFPSLNLGTLVERLGTGKLRMPGCMEHMLAKLRETGSIGHHGRRILVSWLMALTVPPADVGKSNIQDAHGRRLSRLVCAVLDHAHVRDATARRKLVAMSKEAVRRPVDPFGCGGMIRATRDPAQCSSWAPPKAAVQCPFVLSPDSGNDPCGACARTCVKKDEIEIHSPVDYIIHGNTW